VGGAEDDAGDVDEAGIVEPVQHGFMEAAPDADSEPGKEPAVSGRLRYVEAGWPSAPGATADQHANDGREKLSSGASCVPPPCRRTFDGGISGFTITLQAVRNNPIYVPRSMASRRRESSSLRVGMIASALEL
jgi:hypothetical protein